MTSPLGVSVSLPAIWHLWQVPKTSKTTEVLPKATEDQLQEHQGLDFLVGVKLPSFSVAWDLLASLKPRHTGTE